MIKIALHESIKLVDGDIIDELHQAVEPLGDSCPSISLFESPLDLIDKISDSGSDPFDLAILPYDLPGITGVQALVEARETLPELYAIMFSSSVGHASEAAAHLVDGFLVQPVARDAFTRTTGRIISKIVANHRNSTLVNGKGGANRVVFSNILYCETSGHNQIMHLIDGKTVSTRCSSQAMFDALAVDGRFFKAGSSYIVNLHEVSELQSSKGVAVLSDGTEVNVPARLRKGFETALLSLGCPQ